MEGRHEGAAGQVALTGYQVPVLLILLLQGGHGQAKPEYNINSKRLRLKKIVNCERQSKKFENKCVLSVLCLVRYDGKDRNTRDAGCHESNRICF